MAEYEKDTGRTYAKADNMMLKAGARVNGDKTCSMLEVCADTGIEASKIGVTASAGARAYAFQVGNKVCNARFLGADVGANAAFNVISFTKDGRILSAEVKARATLTECNAGPVNAHIGAGISTGAKVEGGIVDAKISGCGVKVGKRIGVSVFDNEISIDTLALVGKGWLW